MAVKVVDKKTGQTFTGKFAVVDKEKVGLFSGCMTNKKGGLRGCGKGTVFDAQSVIITADDPGREIEHS